MGLFDFLKKKPNGGNTESIRPPSMVLRDAGIDPSKLDFDFAADGTTTLRGEVDSEALRARIGELVEGIPQVKAVRNELRVVPPAAAPARTDAEAGMHEKDGDTAAAAAVTPQADGERRHEVVAGDTLWKLAEHYYGQGSDYPKIFEANRDQLDDPDRIRPGQMLKIPD
jgi:nucleoid-associated protein YgaU